MLRNKTKSKEFRPSTGNLDIILSKRIKVIKMSEKMDHSPLRPSSQDYHTSLNHNLLQKHYTIMRHNGSSEKKNRQRKKSEKARSNEFFLHNISVEEENELKEKKNQPKIKTKKENIDRKNNHNEKEDKELNLNKISNKDIEKSAKKKEKMIQEQKETKELKNKFPSFKTFIGSKLRKKLENYLLSINLINFSMKIKFKSPEIKRYIVYVGKGNNSKLIKKIFSNRFWWNIATKKDSNKKVNLVWSQWSKPKVFNSIPKGNATETLKESEEEKNEKQEKLYSKQKANKTREILLKKLSSDTFGELEHVYELLSNEDKNLLLKKLMKKELKLESLKELTSKESFKEFRRMNVSLTHNHIENHQQFTNKKNLFKNLKEMYPDEIFNIVPLTYHVTELGSLLENQDENSLTYVLDKMEGIIERNVEKMEKNVLWIVKPGENSNRGCGIEVFKKLEHIKSHIEKEKQKHPERTFIIQKYLNPFLYHRRKFDIRCYLLVVASPSIKAYYYPTGYIRTSSYEFSSKNCTNKFIHLTNDAIQKKQQEYGKYEKGNKVTYEEFQAYLDLFEAKKQLNFFTEILPIMEGIIEKTVHAMVNSAKQHKLNPNNRQYSFELYGYDFMIDENFIPWLIEINTNPCLETGCEILQEIIPPMMENVMKICVDTAFPPPKLEDWPLNELLTCPENIFEQNMFKLIYNEEEKKEK